jgi:hypothetical protein
VSEAALRVTVVGEPGSMLDRQSLPVGTLVSVTEDAP